VALSDTYGDSCQSYEYSAYGQVAAEDPNFTVNPYMFTGRRFDFETGLYYYRARYYNPYIGRFLQTDPIGYGDGINWYAYCWNNPLNRLDPSGSLVIIPPMDYWQKDNPYSRLYLPKNRTIDSGYPTWWQLCSHAMVGFGGRLTYTDSEACWEWAMSEHTFAVELGHYAQAFLTDIWSYARNNFYDPVTGTFNLEGWDYEYPLSGRYRTPLYDSPIGAKVSFGASPDQYGLDDPYFWIHNVVVIFNYSISIDEDQGGISMSADIKIVDTADLHPERYTFDDILLKLFERFGYTPYPLRIHLGTHTFHYRHLPDENGNQGFTIDGKSLDEY
jgi:RHS repeat-associated protein